MIAHEHLSLMYISGFSVSDGDFVVHGLFGNSQASGYLPSATVPLEWEYPCDFACVQYDEPLETVQARRIAFGGSVARLSNPTPRSLRRTCVVAGIDHTDGLLVFAKPKQSMETYKGVSIRWCVPGALETPQFCIHSALSDYYRIQWGFEPHSIALLQAAQTLQPSKADVFGFCTADQHVFGAAEFTGRKMGELWQVDLFTTRSDRRLQKGDELWGWYTGHIGETSLQAKRLLATIENIPA